MTYVIREVDPASVDAVALMRALDDDLEQRYPGADIHGIAPDAFRMAGGVFLVGYEEDCAVSCAALRRANDFLEVKRMFVLASARRRGHARALLSALEARAVTLGARLIRLETGDGQPEAIALYETAGYSAIPCYAEYAGSPHSRCFEKRLSPIDRVL
jgi:GNAT superfamily N-acetyltransferase